MPRRCAAHCRARSSSWQCCAQTWSSCCCSCPRWPHQTSASAWKRPLSYACSSCPSLAFAPSPFPCWPFPSPSLQRQRQVRKPWLRSQTRRTRRTSELWLEVSAHPSRIALVAVPVSPFSFFPFPSLPPNATKLTSSTSDRTCLGPHSAATGRGSGTARTPRLGGGNAGKPRGRRGVGPQAHSTRRGSLAQAPLAPHLLPPRPVIHLTLIFLFLWCQGGGRGLRRRGGSISSKSSSRSRRGGLRGSGDTPTHVGPPRLVVPGACGRARPTSTSYSSSCSSIATGKRSNALGPSQPRVRLLGKLGLRGRRAKLVLVLVHWNGFHSRADLAVVDFTADAADASLAGRATTADPDLLRAAATRVSGR